MDIFRYIRAFIVFIIITYFVYSGNIWSLKSIYASNSVLTRHTMSLYDRYDSPGVNRVFKDNILLTLAYMSGEVNRKSDIDWNKIIKPFNFDFVLLPGQVFAFHDDIVSLFRNDEIISTNSHFNASEGFLTDGYLYGDGVCHLASLINWASVDAGLYVLAPTRHDFAVIPGIPEKYGVSIYVPSLVKGGGSNNNLYVKNVFDKPVSFAFNYDKDILSLTISKTGD